MDLNYSDIMQIVRRTYKLNDTFRVKELRALVSTPEEADKVSKVIYEMASYHAPVFRRLGYGHYQWICDHIPEQRGSYNARRKAQVCVYCPDCHLALPATRVCDNC